MDDLRDYRFYAEDMSHPSKVAIEYVWDAFIGAAIDEPSRVFMKDYEPIRKSLLHRIKNQIESAKQRFSSDMIERITALAKRFPSVDLYSETAYFSY